MAAVLLHSKAYLTYFLGNNQNLWKGTYPRYMHTISFFFLFVFLIKRIQGTIQSIFLEMASNLKTIHCRVKWTGVWDLDPSST